ncbi:uncharacterized protein LOC144695329 [Cetorhinus maximus]
MAFVKIDNLAKMDSDFYYCEVEVPMYGRGNGTGTQLFVTNKKAADCPPPGVPTSNRTFPLMLGLLGLFVLAILLLLSRLYCQHKAISRLKGSHTVTLARRNDYV